MTKMYYVFLKLNCRCWQFWVAFCKELFLLVCIPNTCYPCFQNRDNWNVLYRQTVDINWTVIVKIPSEVTAQRLMNCIMYYVFNKLTWITDCCTVWLHIFKRKTWHLIWLTPPLFWSIFPIQCIDLYGI